MRRGLIFENNIMTLLNIETLTSSYEEHDIPARYLTVMLAIGTVCGLSLLSIQLALLVFLNFAIYICLSWNFVKGHRYICSGELILCFAIKPFLTQAEFPHPLSRYQRGGI